MTFRIKDLLINVVPEGDACDPGTIACVGGTGDPTTLPERMWHRWPVSTWHCPPPCPGGTGGPGHPGGCRIPTRWFGPDPVEAAEELAILKAELRRELALVEREEKRVEESLRPKDLPEIEALEVKLREALKELERLKSELKKKEQ